MHRLAVWIVAVGSFVVGLGCSGEPPSARPDPDRARECHPPGVDAGSGGFDGGVPGCGPDELCLAGRCYTACAEDGECGPGETCATNGACVRGTVDAGPVDAGPGDPCDGVECTAPSVCHPLSGTCVACSEDTIAAGPGMAGDCGGTDVCDIAKGQCVAPAATQCAPCAVDTDCVVADGFTGRCVTRELMGIRERVCVTDCTDGTCPTGLACVDSICVPPINAPCTNWLAGTNAQPCYSDAECAPLGPETVIYTNACEGESVATTDGGTSTAGVCLRPCNDTAQCETGQECSGTPAYCRAVS